MKKPPDIPFEFFLENLSRLDFTLKVFFGCHAVYVGDKIVFTLRKKAAHPRDNGVWIATSPKYQAKPQKDIPIYALN